MSITYEEFPTYPLKTFLTEIEFEFPDVAYAAMEYYLIRSARELARGGNIVRRKALVETQECVDNYRIDPIDCGEIVAILNICNVCGGLCGEVSRLTHKPCRLSCGSTSWFEKPNTLWIHPGKCGHVYEITFSIMPRFGDCVIDEGFMTHLDTLLNGVRSYLYALPDKPWTNLSLAGASLQRFKKGIYQDAIEVAMGGQRGVFRGFTNRLISR